MIDYEIPQRKVLGKLLIVGTGYNADIMSYLFENSSNFKMVGYAVDEVNNYVFRGKPVYPLESLEQVYDPSKPDNYIFVAVGNNRIRSRIYNNLKERGYQFATFISDKAVVYPNVKIGENVFIFENNVIQYKCEIGNNTILWSGNHIGHESIVEEDVFISSHCVISGFCCISKGSFLGVNSTIVDNIILPEESFVKAGSLVIGD